jgi:RNA polymerase sigma-70 factor (ECF subfamily)
MIPKPKLSMNTDSRTNVRAARDEGMGGGIVRHMSSAMLEFCIQLQPWRVETSMNRIDVLPLEIELAQLLQRCAAKDSAAFRTLYDKTSPILFARLLRLLRRRSVAEEVLQDVYVRIWQRAVQFEAHRGRALAWMVTIARYCAIDLMRRERMTLVSDDSLAEIPDDAAPEDGGVEKPNNFDFCIGQLNETTRACLTLAFVDGRSHDEIAQITTNPLGSVKSWIRRGLLALRECLSSGGQAA